MSVIINHHEYVTVKELSDLLGVHASTIYKWAKKKIIKPFTYGYTKRTRAGLVRDGLITKEEAESIGKEMLFDKNLMYIRNENGKPIEDKKESNMPLSKELIMMLGKEKAEELVFYVVHTFKGTTAEEFEKWQDECDKNDIDPCAICPVRHECNFLQELCDRDDVLTGTLNETCKDIFECSMEASKMDELMNLRMLFRFKPFSKEDFKK